MADKNTQKMTAIDLVKDSLYRRADKVRRLSKKRGKWAKKRMPKATAMSRAFSAALAEVS